MPTVLFHEYPMFAADHCAVILKVCVVVEFTAAVPSIAQETPLPERSPRPVVAAPLAPNIAIPFSSCIVVELWADR